MQDINSKVKKILEELSEKVDFTNDVDIFEKGIIDSLATIKLIYKLEENFKINIAKDDIKKDNLNTVGNISCFIKKKLDN